jgi:zinc transporter 2
MSILGEDEHGHGHSHSHDIGVAHDSSDDSDEEAEGKNVNIQAAYLHVLGDMLMSIGVCIAATVIYFFPDW